MGRSAGNHYDETVAAITLSGSALSAVASFCVLVWFAVYNKTQRSLRHALVLNLTLSDFINAFLNTISGSHYVRHQVLLPGAACTFEGWLEQLSVQATDFSILAISIVTLLVVLQTGRLTQVSTLKKALICSSIWLMPLITSTTATAMGAMGPVSGNWCWIKKERTDLRYGLTHGWRMAIIFITIGIYTYVWIHVSRHFRSLGAITGSTYSCGSGNGQRSAEDEDPMHVTETGVVYDPSSKDLLPKTSAVLTSYSSVDQVPCQPTGTPTPAPRTSAPLTPGRPGDLEQNAATTFLQERARRQMWEVKKMLLMNGYPIFYVLLWIPGLVNRIMEAAGAKTTSRVLAVLQASTQFIGFANAVTYGLSGIWKAGK